MRYSLALGVGLLGVAASMSSFVGCVGDSSTDNDATAPDTGSDITVTKDAPVDTGPTGCAARSADDNAGIFVAASGNDVNGCGTRANPCKTLAFSIAVAKASATKTTLYIAAGTYQESVNIDVPLTLEGG
jgi:hypothetical protein